MKNDKNCMWSGENQTITAKFKFVVKKPNYKQADF